mgnify:CR=1 FL=1
MMRGGWWKFWSPWLGEERRRQVLEDLDAGKLTADAAMRILRGEEA